MVNSLKKYIVLLFLCVGGTVVVCSQSVEPMVYVKGGFHTIIVSIWNRNNTCRIEQYNNLGTSLNVEYHKAEFTYKQIDGHLILSNRNSKAPLEFKKHTTESYYSLCFYPQTHLYGGELFPTLLQRYGVVANEDGYFYELPLECTADLLFSDSCMALRFGEKAVILLQRLSTDDANRFSETSVKEPLANLWGWSAFWNNRVRVHDDIDMADCIVGHTFKSQEDSIYFGRRRIGFRYSSLLQKSSKFKYSLHESYIIIADDYSKDTLLFRDGVLYDALVVQNMNDASRKLVMGPGGVRQEPTGAMKINAYVDQSIHAIDTNALITSAQKYFFPINFHRKQFSIIEK